MALDISAKSALHSAAMNPIIKELATEMGQPPYAVRKWKARGKVPHMHRLTMLELAAEQGKQLKASDFDFGQTTKRRKPRRRSRSQQASA